MAVAKIDNKEYMKSAIRVMELAMKSLYPKGDLWVRVLFSVGNNNGYFCIRSDKEPATDEFLGALKARMKELIAQDVVVSTTTGGERNSGFIQSFELEAYEEGFVIFLPVEKGGADKVLVSKKHYKTLKYSVKWNDLIGVNSIKALNNIITEGRIRDLVLMQEAHMEANIAACANEVMFRPECRFVMIAGPSSSGKTTFSHRLSVQLRCSGITPHPVALDDYYLDRDKTPLDEDGKPDFECVESLDVERFNRDMKSLLSGKETELPVFNFNTGKRADVGRTLKLGEKDVLVIEGINGLNDALSYSLPVESKFKIYISALNTLSIDDYSPLSTTDVRILRRIVRDARVRNTDARRTFSMWPSVRKGELKNIFPFQDSADYMFNSSLLYEPAVMKLYAEPHLAAITPGEEHFLEAERLRKVLSHVLPMPTEDIPNNSLIREFIGGGCFGV